MMWKLAQFGLVYLPKLNSEYIHYFQHSQNADDKHDRSGAILYTDIFFLVLFNFDAVTGVYAITFATVCLRALSYLQTYTFHFLK